MMYEFNLHRKTVTAYLFHSNYLTSPYRSLNDDYEQLYHAALQDVLWQAYQILKKNDKKRITVKLNKETTRMLYHRAVHATSSYVNLNDMKHLPTYKTGLKQLRFDLKDIVDKCKGNISLGYQPEPRLKALQKEIAQECEIVE